MRQLYSEDIVEILSKVFNYNKTDTNIGMGVKMSSYDAFLFSLITGAGYLENKIFPYTPKGHLKIFQNALDYKFVTGLFENYSFRTSPLYLNDHRPYLFNGEKTIIPIDFNSEKELKEKLDDLNESFNENCLILRVETYKKGNGLESFLEYLSCKYFNSLGYITENQIPLFPTVGSPDFGGFKLIESFKSHHGYLFNSGFNIVELSLIRLFPNFYQKSIVVDEINFIVGEAKTSTFNVSNQLQKYIDTKLFNQSIEIFPSQNSSITNNSVFYISENNEIVFKEGIGKLEVDNYKQQEYHNWLLNYCSLYLLSNLTNDEFRIYYKHKTNSEFDEGYKLIDFISNLKINELINDLFNYINHGSFK